MFGSAVSMKSISIFCRSLSTLLDSGVSAHKAFQIAGEKAASPVVRRTSCEIAEELQKGQDIATALQEQAVYPELMVNMVYVAEQTGTLPEMLKGLAEHYENLLRLKKDFYRAISWPVIQLVLAVFVIAGLIFILGAIADSQGGEPVDVLGWGLTGTSGALIWLGMVFGTAFLLFLGYRFLKASIVGQKYLDGVLLRIPVVGHCMRSFAIARFAWAYHLTQEAGLPVDESIHSSMQATNNGAFIGAAPEIIYWLKQGETVTDALRFSQLFPEDVLAMIHVGEATGTVPETLHRLSPQFEDEARRSLQAMAGALSWVVWILVAVFIIFVVFSIAFWYIGIINDALQNV